MVHYNVVNTIETVFRCWLFFAIIADILCQQIEQTSQLERRQAQACECGTKQRRRRIVGGVETAVDELPWTVLIQRKLRVGTPEETTIQLCGGTLIAKNFIVSAAHCFNNDVRVSELFVDIGDHDWSTTNEVRSIIIAVSKLTIHPNYVSTEKHDDIAVLKLISSVTYSPNIQQACFPPPGMDLAGTTVTVAGWGSTEEAGPESNVLMSTTVPVISTRECQAKYSGTKEIIGASTICAGTEDGSRDACQGDSGGPLIYDCKDRYTFVGVVSFGIGCGTPDIPGVYANVSFYRSWVLSNVENAALCGYTCYPPKPEEVDCGWPNVRLRKRVVGGSITRANEYPWMVAIFAKILNKETNEYSFTFVCGATLISRDWVLTTAKCVFGYSLADLMLIIGEYDTNDVFNNNKQVTVPKRLVTHPRYNSPYGNNDIAALQLTDPAKFSATISPICIPNADSVSPTLSNAVLKLLGFGRTRTGGPYSGRLKEVNLATVDAATCKATYFFLTDNMVCTASSATGDACEGDSGGPLMMKDRFGRHFQLALQSLVFGRNGVAVCGSGNPSVNTKIAPYVGWIFDTTGVRSLKPGNQLPPPPSA